MVSLMNGLSTMGAGIAQFAGTAGLEYQKAALANQSAILADQLATTRETTLQGQQQQYQSGENVASRAATAANLATTAAAEMQRTQADIASRQSTNAATIAAEAERQRVGFTAPTDLEKTLRFINTLNPDGTLKTGGGTSPSTTGTTGASTGTATPSTSAEGSPSGASTTPAQSTTDPSLTSVVPSSGATAGSGTSDGTTTPQSIMRENAIRKAQGLPAVGSPEATRYAIAQDVKTDPSFKYKTAGQQAAEVELRVAIAEGKMTDPASRESMAQGIASYQIAPLSGFSLTKPGGPETMARAIQLNPDYQESRYPEVNKAMSAFGSGKQGDIVRSLNVGVQHLDVLDQAGRNLGNTDVNVVNSLKNAFQQQFGSAAPTTFDGLKQIVGTEVEKAVAGGIGSSSDRDRIMAALNRANSPAQLQAITDGFRALMIGQLSGLKTQYEEATGFKTGPFVFESKLVPATIKGLHGGGATSSAATDTTAAPASVSAAPAGPQTVYTDSGPVDLPASGARATTTPAAVVPPWVKPGDQYSPSLGRARGADGNLYGPAQ